MYLFENMIDMVLPEGITWPTEKHRQVAIRLLLSNPRVSKLNDLQLGVMHIIKIPKSQITQIELDEVIDFDTYIFPIIIKI